jgi:transketolase
MEFSPSGIRVLSMLGQRGAFGMAVNELAGEDGRIFALSADLRTTSGLDRFAKNYPDRFVNVGVAEQNMVGVAAGLADSGYTVFAATFANFASLRACEFVRHFMGYMRSPVVLVGFGAGFAMELFGNTHYGVEDVAALRSIPGLTILSPADGLETVKCVQACANYGKPVYLRLTGAANNPAVYKSDYAFEIGKAVTLREGGDVAIIAAGSMAHAALGAAALLDGIPCSVINMHTIKPLDTEAISKLLDRKLIVTVEEHSAEGGLGGAAAEYVSGIAGAPPLLRIGAGAGYAKAGAYPFMLEQNGLTPSLIARRIRARLSEVAGGGGRRA